MYSHTAHPGHDGKHSVHHEESMSRNPHSVSHMHHKISGSHTKEQIKGHMTRMGEKATPAQMKHEMSETPEQMAQEEKLGHEL